MTKRIAVLGDKTTTGGVIISASGSIFDGQHPIALLGDKVICPKCDKGQGVIIECAKSFIIDGKGAAYDNCLVSCGCPMGRNRIIATKGLMFLDG
jgi:uncharacterized Zn-binding protein involved in type VI secretion